MEKLQDGSSTAHESKGPGVHRWDARTRSNTCGAPGNTGSTKHTRGVTCHACLELLEREREDEPQPVHH